MSTNNLIGKHSSEMISLKIRQQKEWGALLKEQDAALMKETNMVGMAERFQEQREAHNKKYAQERKETLQRQQKELEEQKKLQQKRSNKDVER